MHTQRNSPRHLKMGMTGDKPLWISIDPLRSGLVLRIRRLIDFPLVLLPALSPLMAQHSPSGGHRSFSSSSRFYGVTREQKSQRCIKENANASNASEKRDK